MGNSPKSKIINLSNKDRIFFDFIQKIEIDLFKPETKQIEENDGENWATIQNTYLPVLNKYTRTSEVGGRILSIFSVEDFYIIKSITSEESIEIKINIKDFITIFPP